MHHSPSFWKVKFFELLFMSGAKFGRIGLTESIYSLWFGMPVNLAIFDGDGTISTTPNPFLLIASQLDCYQEVQELIAFYLQKQITYDELIAGETQVFKRDMQKAFDRTWFKTIVNELPLEIYEDVAPTIAGLKQCGIEVVLISSGIADIIAEVAQQAGIQEWYANAISYKEDLFEGFQVHVTGDKIAAIQKVLQAKRIHPKHVMYLGDNEFDYEAMKYILRQGGQAFAVRRHAQEILSFPEGVQIIHRLTDILDHSSVRLRYKDCLHLNRTLVIGNKKSHAKTPSSPSNRRPRNPVKSTFFTYFFASFASWRGPKNYYGLLRRDCRTIR
jgi:HAD superfamily phosphoserine phosphatase-like hydrolase